MAETIRQRRRRLLRERMSQEKIFRQELQREFGQVVEEFERRYRTTGEISGAVITRHRARLENLLSQRYRKIQNRFKGVAADELRVPRRTDNVFRDLAAAALETWTEEVAFSVSGRIVVTTGNNIRDNLERSRIAIIGRGLVPDRPTLAAEAVALLRRTFRGRSRGIATTETTNAVEITKRTEAQIFGGQVPEFAQGQGLPPIEDPPAGQVRKNWITVGDDRVRPTHVQAGLTQKAVPLDEPFTVGGFSLQYPRDSSLGAPPEEIINCRCSTEYRRIET